MSPEPKYGSQKIRLVAALSYMRNKNNIGSHVQTFEKNMWPVCDHNNLNVWTNTTPISVWEKEREGEEKAINAERHHDIVIL